MVWKCVRMSGKKGSRWPNVGQFKCMHKSKKIPWKRMERQALLVKWHQLTKRRALK